MELETMTALELAAKIKQRQIHVVDGVKAVFDQIESKEETVHAYLDLYKKEAYARAKEVEKGIAHCLILDSLQICSLRSALHWQLHRATLS